MLCFDYTFDTAFLLISSGFEQISDDNPKILDPKPGKSKNNEHIGRIRIV